MLNGLQRVLLHQLQQIGFATSVCSNLRRDIGDVETLLDIAEELGLDRAMTARFFESDADIEDIRARDAHTRARGVTGVPTFVVGNQHVVPGAQPTELWLKVIDEIAANPAEPAESPSG